jgi:hypothetical protein
LSYCDTDRQFVVDNFNRIAKISTDISSSSDELEEQLDAINNIIKIIPYIEARMLEGKIIDKISELSNNSKNEDTSEGYDYREVGSYMMADKRNDYYEMFSGLLIK